MTGVRPLFLLSMPRAGSTLLQRILATHPTIATTAEPWLLLPPFYALRQEGVRAEYRHATLAQAVREFCLELPEGLADYRAAVRAFALDLYGRAAEPDARWFLDKTPRYGLICTELVETFPDAKFIFLWRNPLAVVASMCTTWMSGRWRLRSRRTDLYDVFSGLIEGFGACGDRALAVQYEKLVAEPRAQIERVARYVGIEPRDEMLNGFGNVRFAGQLGDPTGRYEYKAVDTRPVEKWKRAFTNPLRKSWGRTYLRWIGPERLAVMGYDLDELLAELSRCRGGLGGVISDLAFGALDRLVPPQRQRALWLRRRRRAAAGDGGEQR